MSQAAAGNFPGHMARVRAGAGPAAAKIGMEGTSTAVVLGGTSFDENVDKRKADLYQEVASMPGGVVGSTVV